MTTLSLSGKVVFITGAASGIGAAFARRARAEGALLVLVDLSLESCSRLAEELGSACCLPIEASVTDAEAMNAAAELAVLRFGGIDIVFANAGIACEPPTTTRQIAAAKFEKIIEVNLMGVWRTVHSCLPHIINRRGHILVTASIYAFFNGVANAPYAISKAGVEMFGRALRAELAGTGATAGVLYPGWVTTPISQSALGGHAIASQMINEGFPAFLRRPISPDVVAEAILRGITTRAARIIVPRRWAPISLLRGLVNAYSDRMFDRNTRLQQLMRQLEANNKKTASS